VVHFIGDKKKCTNQLFSFFKDFIGIAFLGIFGDLHVRTKKIRFLGNYFCIVVAQMLLGRSTLGYVFTLEQKKKESDRDSILTDTSSIIDFALPFAMDSRSTTIYSFCILTLFLLPQ
jgi:hypothetical protein